MKLGLSLFFTKGNTGAIRQTTFRATRKHCRKQFQLQKTVDVYLMTVLRVRTICASEILKDQTPTANQNSNRNVVVGDYLSHIIHKYRYVTRNHELR